MAGKAINLRGRNDYYGLLVVGGSLAVIVFIVYLLLNQHRDTQLTLVQTQGNSVARILSGMSLEQLIPEDSSTNVLEVLRLSISPEYFAYASVDDSSGVPKRQVSAFGMSIPPALANIPPNEWFGQRLLNLELQDAQLTEFYAPLLEAGVHQGFVRVGLVQPGWGLSGQQIAFVATMALAVFLLVPMFYYPVRRQLDKISDVGQALEQTLADGDLRKVELEASGELGTFISRVNAAIEQSAERMRDLEHEAHDAEVSRTLLTYNRERVESVLQSIPSSVMTLDEFGTPTYVNARCVALLGSTAEDILDNPVQSWCTNSELSAFLENFKISDRKPDYSQKMLLTSEFAPDKIMQVSAYPLFHVRDRSSVTGTLIQLTDVTEQHQALQNRSDFIAHIAHELKTPLNTLSLYSESLLDQGDDEEFRTEAVNVISDEVERLATLINNLLRLTQLELGVMNLKRTPVKVGDLMGDTFDAIARSASRSGVKCSKKLPRSFATLNVDKEMIRIALTNLISNAIKYSDENDKVVLSAEDLDDRIVIRVTDTGIGISAEDLENIFDKHYRADNDATQSRSGHGLGLPLAREIIMLHQGRLTVQSKLGEGSEFTIEFPKSSGIVSQTI